MDLWPVKLISYKSHFHPNRNTAHLINILNAKLSFCKLPYHKTILFAEPLKHWSWVMAGDEPLGSEADGRRLCAWAYVRYNCDVTGSPLRPP